MPDHRPRAYDLPQIAEPCPPPPEGCGSPADELCTSHGGTRVRRTSVHQARTAAWSAGRSTAQESAR